MKRLTDDDMMVLRLIKRTKPGEDGWRCCAPKIYSVIIEKISSELIEIRTDSDGKNFVRPSPDGEVLLKWLG